jgi:hypothetical protein
MPTKTETQFTGLFDQAVESFGESMKVGVKFQEDLAKWWADALEQTGPMQNWHKRTRAMVSEVVPAAQKNAEEWMRIMEDNYRRSIDLMRRAFEPTQSTNPAEMQARTRELWEASLEVIRNNAQAMAQANVRMMELWSDILRRNMDGVRAAGRTMASAAGRAASVAAGAARSASK